MKRIPHLFLCLLMASTGIGAAEPETGPAVKSYGPVFAVPEGSYNLDPGQQYKVVMDVGEGPDDPAAVNRRIESVARFLNMHARNGIDADQLDVALVLHGSAARALLTDSAHQAAFGVANGNRGLVEELAAAGVDIYLCGQTAAYRGFAPAQLLPAVELAVSAMTVHVRLQQEGYRAILF